MDQLQALLECLNEAGLDCADVNTAISIARKMPQEEILLSQINTAVAILNLCASQRIIDAIDALTAAVVGP